MPGMRQLSNRNISSMRNLLVTAYTPDQSAFTETRLASAGPDVVLSSVELRVTSPLRISSKLGILLSELL